MRLLDRLRVAQRLLLVFLHVAWGVALVALAFPWFGDARRDRAITKWSRCLLGFMGVRLRVEALPHLPHGALVVANHVSWLDVYLIHAAHRVHFVSKSEVRRWPIAGWLAHRTGTLFLERQRRADTLRVSREMGEVMTQGAWVAVFPEGRTGDGRSVRKFLPSLLQPAVELACPVVPVALRYCTLAGEYSDAPVYESVNLVQSFLRIIREPGLVAEVRFGAPLAATAHRRELAATAEAAVAALLGVSPAPSSADTAPRTPPGPPA